MIKFIIDEDMPRSTGKVLKEQGYDVRDIRDYGLRGAEDDKIYEFAQKEEMKLTNFEQLEAWQQVRKLAKVIYQFVKKQNFSKDFRLVNQTTGKTNVKCGDLTPFYYYSLKLASDKEKKEKLAKNLSKFL